MTTEKVIMRIKSITWRSPIILLGNRFLRSLKTIRLDKKNWHWTGAEYEMIWSDHLHWARYRFIGFYFRWTLTIFWLIFNNQKDPKGGISDLYCWRWTFLLLRSCRKLISPGALHGLESADILVFARPIPFQTEENIVFRKSVSRDDARQIRAGLIWWVE